MNMNYECIVGWTLVYNKLFKSFTNMQSCFTQYAPKMIIPRSTAFITVWFCLQSVSKRFCNWLRLPSLWRLCEGERGMDLDWTLFSITSFFLYSYICTYVCIYHNIKKSYYLCVYYPWREFCFCIFISNIDVRRVNPYTLHVRNYSWAMMVLSWFALVWEASAVLYSQLLVSSSPKIWIDE